MFVSCKVYVEYPDGSPASDVSLLVQPGDVEGITAQNGFARVPINPSGNDQQLRITVSQLSSL